MRWKTLTKRAARDILTTVIEPENGARPLSDRPGAQTPCVKPLFATDRAKARDIAQSAHRIKQVHHGRFNGETVRKLGGTYEFRTSVVDGSTFDRDSPLQL